MSEKLAPYVPVRMNEKRIDAQWAAISSRLPLTQRAPRRVALWTLGSVAAAAAASAWLVVEQVEPHPPLSAWAGSVVRSNEAPVEIALSDYARVEVLPSSEIAFLSEGDASVGLSLERGSTHLSFDEGAPRAFRVRTASYEVIGAGGDVRVTRVVGRDGEDVRVSVTQGAVEIRRRDGTEEDRVRLSAGHHWSAFAAFAQVAETHEARVVAPEATKDSADEAAEKRERRDRKRRQRRGERPSAEAQELFDRANVARRGGNVREAELLYAEMLSKYAENRRTALAAFELGRIRMDSLGDPKGAAQALQRALALDGRAAFSEDALARLALALEAVGDVEGCKDARSRYTKTYPDGVHTQNLEHRCKGS